MGFLNGRVTYQRFRHGGPRPSRSDEEHLDRLRDHAAGRQRIAAADGIEVGWTAGGHVLDTDFQLEKNAVSDALCFDLRVDQDRIPTALLKAYYEVELKALSKNNPSGLPSAKQKREAREIARERLEQEAKDGRFRKQKLIPVLWDGLSNEVMFGATGYTDVHRLASLFRQTFGVELEAVTAGRQAYHYAELLQRTRGVDDSGPSAFVPGVSPDDVAWIADEVSRDFLGNEFLLWLWFTSDGESDAVNLADGSEAVFMFARKLVVECPRGQTGIDGFGSDGPTRLPEARRAVQSGKLPRKAGLTLVRHDRQYELTLHAETLAVGSAKLPKPDEESARARVEERIASVRHLRETLDGLYRAFLDLRLGPRWGVETLPRMQRWLQREERAAA